MEPVWPIGHSATTPPRPAVGGVPPILGRREEHWPRTSTTSSGGFMATRTAPLIPAGTWTVDPAHSTVEFSVKHMGIANVRRPFSDFEGTLAMQEEFAECRA